MKSGATDADWTGWGHRDLRNSMGLSSLDFLSALHIPEASNLPSRTCFLYLKDQERESLARGKLLGDNSSTPAKHHGKIRDLTSSHIRKRSVAGPALPEAPALPTFSLQVSMKTKSGSR